MRTIYSESFLSAISNDNGARFRTRLTCYKSRSFIEATDLTDESPSAWTLSGEYVRGDKPGTSIELIDASYNDQTLVEYSGHFYTAIPTGGTIYISKDGSTAPVDTGLSCAEHQRPGFIAPYLCYVDDGHIKLAELDMTVIRDGIGTPVIDVLEIAATSLSGECIMISSTEFMFVYINNGGIGISYYWYDSSISEWIPSTCPQRIMIPDRILLSTDSNLLNYSTAVKFGSDVIFYFSMPSGYIKAVRCNVYAFSGTTTVRWQDFYEAAPADTATFSICNGFVYANRIFLSCQFTRTSQFADGTIYNLLLWSDDGKTFCIDRFTCYSILGYHFSVLVGSGGDLYISDSNIHASDTPPFFVSSDLAPTTEILAEDIKSISGSLEQTIQVSLANGTEKYMDDSLYTKVGCVCDIDVEVITGDTEVLDEHLEVIGMTAVWEGGTGPFLRCIISGTSISYPSRQFTMDLVHEGLWRTSTMTYPFYLEFNSKSSMREDITSIESGALAPFFVGAGAAEILAVDFWNEANGFAAGGLTPGFHLASSSKTYQTGDLKTKIGSAYPVIKTLPISAKIYGWSRLGLAATNPNTADPTSTSGVNDTFQLILSVQQPDLVTTYGVTQYPVRTVTVPLGDGINYPPQSPFVHSHDGSWTVTDPPASRSGEFVGAYPVEYAGISAGLLVNDRIIDIGVKCASDYPTVMHVERVEIPEVTMYVPDAEQKVETITVAPNAKAESWDFETGAQGWVGTGNNDDLWSANPRPPCDYGGWVGGSGQTSKEARSGRLYMTSISAGPGDYGGKCGYWYIDISPVIYVTEDSVITGVMGPRVNSTGWYTPACYGYVGVRFEDGSHAWSSILPEGEFSWNPSYNRVGYGVNRIYFWTYMVQKEGPIMEIYMDSCAFSGFDDSIYNPDKDATATKRFKVIPRSNPITFEAQRPFLTFNFETMCDFQFYGEGSYVGLYGLCTDSGGTGGTIENYIAFRVSCSNNAKAQIIKMRSSIPTILATVDITQAEGSIRLRFVHRNGEFYGYIKDPASLSFGDPVVSYSWTEADGVLCDTDLVMKVGAYTFIDVPRFRIAGFNPTISTNIGMMPGYDQSALDDFPSSGIVEIGGVKYIYVGKTPNAIIPRGPYQLRCPGLWHTDNPDETSQHYNGGTLDITHYAWQSDSDHRADYGGYLAASQAGYAPVINDVDWKAWITTDGKVVWFLNRARVYCDTIPAVSNADKVSIVPGLLNLSKYSGEPTAVTEGTYCYLDRMNDIYVSTFMSSSESDAIVIADILTQMVNMAGASASFPGDVEVTRSFAGGTAWEVV